MRPVWLVGVFISICLLFMGFFGLSGIRSLVGFSFTGTYEDFTSFTVVDPEGQLQVGHVTATEIFVNTLNRQDEFYLWKSYGAGKFGSNFTLDFDVKVHGTGTAGSIYLFRIADSPTSSDFIQMYMWCSGSYGTAATVYFYLQTSTGGQDFVMPQGSDGNFPLDTTYHFTVSRASGTVTMAVTQGTTPIGTKTLVCPTTAYQNLYVMKSPNNGIYVSSSLYMNSLGITFGTASPSTYTVRVIAHCNTDNKNVAVQMTAGTQTPVTSSDNTFTLTGDTVITVADHDPDTHPLLNWDGDNAKTSPSITVTSAENGGLHHVYYAATVTTYTVNCNAHCTTESKDVVVGWKLNGNPVPNAATKTFSGLSGTNTIECAPIDLSGHPFKNWDFDSSKTNTLLTVTQAGNHNATYEEAATSRIVTIKANCNTEGGAVQVHIGIDGGSGRFAASADFIDLVIGSSHTFTVDAQDGNSHPFKNWDGDTSKTSPTLQVTVPSSDSQHIAYYEAITAPAKWWIWFYAKNTATGSFVDAKVTVKQGSTVVESVQTGTTGVQWQHDAGSFTADCEYPSGTSRGSYSFTLTAGQPASPAQKEFDFNAGGGQGFIAFKAYNLGANAYVNAKITVGSTTLYTTDSNGGRFDGDVGTQYTAVCEYPSGTNRGSHPFTLTSGDNGEYRFEFDAGNGGGQTQIPDIAKILTDLLDNATVRLLELLGGFGLLGISGVMFLTSEKRHAYVPS